MSNYRKLADNVVKGEPVHQEIANIERSIVASALTCKFGDIPVVDVLSLNIQPGTVYGFLGPNGAGKTTVIRMLCGLVKPTEGNAYIGGVHASRYTIEAQRRLYLTFADPKLDPTKTAREHMVLQGQLYDLSRAQAKHRTQQLLKLFELEDLADRWIATYSHGQRQKVDIATAILVDPDVLILDEPTSALDIENSMLIRRCLRDFADRGRAVLIATHALGSAADICDEFGIIQHGRIKASGSFEQLRQASSLSCDVSMEQLFMDYTGTRQFAHPLHNLDWIRGQEPSSIRTDDAGPRPLKRVVSLVDRVRNMLSGSREQSAATDNPDDDVAVNDTARTPDADQQASAEESADAGSQRGRDS